MKVGIIIPAYQSERFITYTLQSVLGQTHTDWALVIVDDGSRDSTLAIAEGYAASDPRIRVAAQQNKGVAEARNRGLRELGPEWEAIIFLDHDDLWRPETLSILIDALRAHPECVGAHGLALAVNSDDMSIGFCDQGEPAHRRRRKLLARWGRIFTVSCNLNEPTTFGVQAYDGPISSPGQMLARRSALEKIDGFDSSITPCDDWDYWARLSLIGPIAFVDAIVLNWRSHGGNASGSKSFMGYGVSQMRRKLFSLPELSPTERRIAHYRYKRMYCSVERHNAKDCFLWSRQEWQAGRFKEAREQLARAVALYGRYLMLSIFWGGELDRGPIPERLSDDPRNAPAPIPGSSAPIPPRL